MMKYNLSDKDFKNIGKWINDNRNEIHSILSGFATYHSVEEEINASLRTLNNASLELKKYSPKHISTLVVYHPSNALLYSYVLYALIPSAFVKNIIIRPSGITSQYMIKIQKLFSFVCNFSIQLKVTTQNKFREQTQHADVVVFTGKYANSLELSRYYNNSIFIYFGSGYNPVIFSEDVDPLNAVDVTLKSRLLNSGQDCFMSDIFFVNESIVNQYLQNLIKKIKTLTYGMDADSDYGPIHYNNVFPMVKQFLAKHIDKIVYSGQIDEKKHLLSPTVLFSPIEDIVEPIEFFSPVFNVISYNDINKVKSWLLNKSQLTNAMGLSIYGNNISTTDLIGKYNIFHEMTVLEAENGNEPFGGYGMKANYIKNGEIYSTGPILISKVVGVKTPPFLSTI